MERNFFDEFVVFGRERIERTREEKRGERKKRRFVLGIIVVVVVVVVVVVKENMLFSFTFKRK